MAGELVITSPANGFTVNASTLTVTVTTVFMGATQYVQISRPNFIPGRPDWKEVYPGTVTGGTYSVVVPIVQGTDDWPIKIDAFEVQTESGSLLHAVPVNGTIKGIAPPADSRLVEVPVIDNTFSATIPITQGPSVTPLTIKAASTDGTVISDPVHGSIAATLVPIGIQVDPPTIIGGKSGIGRIDINKPATSGGVTITLWTDDPAIIAVPPSLFIPEGATFGTFPVTTFPVTEEIEIRIWSQLGLTSIGMDLPVLPPPPPPNPCLPTEPLCYGIECCNASVWYTGQTDIFKQVNKVETAGHV